MIPHSLDPSPQTRKGLDCLPCTPVISDDRRYLSGERAGAGASPGRGRAALNFSAAMQLQQSARPALALFGLLALSAVALLCYHAPGDGPTFARKISGMFANMTGVDDESGHILPANVVQTVAEQKVHAALSVEEISAMWLKNAESVRAPTAVMAVQATMLEAPPPPPPPFEDKTMGELNTEVARLKDAIDVKTDTLSKTPNGDERNSLKLDVRNMKEQKSAMKAAFKRKKESAPVLCAPRPPPPTCSVS